MPVAPATPPAPVSAPLPAKAKAQVAAVAAPSRPRDPPAFAYAALLFADATPSSSRLVPFSATHQMGVLTGVMVGAGVLIPGILRVLALARGGYGAAGREPGKGDDGIFLGGGLLVSLAALPEMDIFQRLEPFVRLHLDGRVVQTSDTANGALGLNPFSLAVGIMAANGFGDVHATFGGDVAGGLSVGFGLSFGYAR